MTAHRPTVAAAIAFHLGGLALAAAATVAAGFAALIVSFGTSTCRDLDTGGERVQLQLGLLAIGAVLTLVPVAWGLLGWRIGRAWQPWAALTVVPALVTTYVVATAQVGTWCF